MDAKAVGDPLETDGKVSIALLWARYRVSLVRLFLRRGYAHDVAEDCAQDVFVRIAKTDFARVENIEAYLFAVASSVVLDNNRKMRSRLAALHEPLGTHEIDSLEVSPARVLEGREALLRVDKILDELRPRTREIFLMNRLDGLSYAEIATQVGIGVAGVHKHMSLALAHLRKRFSSHD